MKKKIAIDRFENLSVLFFYVLKLRKSYLFDEHK